jgi:hypothetical protein
MRVVLLLLRAVGRIQPSGCSRGGISVLEMAEEGGQLLGAKGGKQQVASQGLPAAPQKDQMGRQLRLLQRQAEAQELQLQQATNERCLLQQRRRQRQQEWAQQQQQQQQQQQHQQQQVRPAWAWTARRCCVASLSCVWVANGSAKDTWMELQQQPPTCVWHLYSAPAPLTQLLPQLSL